MGDHRPAERTLLEALVGLGLDAHLDGDRVVLEGSGVSLRVTSEVDDIDRHAVLVRRRITAAAKHRFERDGSGWLDGRRLKIRAAGLIVDSDAAVLAGPGRPDRALQVLAGRAVSAVTINALMSWPQPMDGVRALAERAGVSPGGVSLAAKRLVDAGLLTEDRRATSDLFWATAREWKPQWDEGPMDLRGLEDEVVDVSAGIAASLGAPIAAGPGSTREFLVPSRVCKSLALTGTPNAAAGRVAEAPSPLAVPGPADPPEATAVVVALTLATDAGRGAEIVENWDGDHVWH